jgi:hypothetical protein
MYPVLPPEIMSGALEMVCYVCTAVGALLSLLLSMRF